MFLSRLLIDTGNDPDRLRPGRSWLRNVYRVHQRLCMAFPAQETKISDPDFLQPYNPQNFGGEDLKQVQVKRADKNGFLFRIDSLEGRTMILVQSAQEPDWDYAFHNAMYFLAAPPETKLFTPDFQEEQVCRFRLTANPTRKVETKTRDDGKRRHGKRIPVPNAQHLEWLIQRGKKGGFAISEGEPTIQPGYVSFCKSPKTDPVRLRSVRYDGLLRVTDPEKFHETLIQGVGPGKGLGFGLLSAVPLI